MSLKDWGYKKIGDHSTPWPTGDDGQAVKPAFLEHIVGSQLEVDLAVNMLQAFEIPVMLAYPNDGEFGKLILGFAGTGVDIMVPETLIEDARNIISADIQPETEEE